MISCPMPSPGRTATFISEVPGVLGLAPVLEGADLVRVAQAEADLVETVQQAVLAERIDVEAKALRPVRRLYRLGVEIDGELEPREGSGVVEQLVDLRLRQHHRQETVLQRVAGEDVAEGRRDDGTETVVAQ